MRPLAELVAAVCAGDRRAIAFHGEVRVGILPLERVRTFGDPSLIFLNVNTSDELAQAEAEWLARGSSRS